MPDWKEITYDYGNEHDPVNPDRLMIELSDDGSIHVTHLRGRARRDWRGRQASSLWPSVIAALEKAAFPRRPENVPQALVPGTSNFSVRARSATGEDAIVKLPTSVGFDGYRELSGLMMTIIGQTSADIFGFEMPEEPRLITDVEPA